MDRQGPQPALTPTGSSGRAAIALAVVTAIALAMLVAKPWASESTPMPSSGNAASPTARRSTTIATSASPSDGDRAAAPEPVTDTVGDDCLDPLGWRVFSIERWGDGTVRDWTASGAVAATGPLDPGIPFTPVIAERVVGLGYCAPVAGPQRPRESGEVAIWRLDAGGARPLTPGRLRPRSYSILGALYGAPPSEARPSSNPTPSADPHLPLSPTWPDGRYVFDVDGHWFGAVVSLAVAPSGEAGAPSAPA